MNQDRSCPGSPVIAISTIGNSTIFCWIKIRGSQHSQSGAELKEGFWGASGYQIKNHKEVDSK